MGSTMRSTQVEQTLVDLLPRLDQFVQRHVGPNELDIARMVAVIGVDSLDALIDETVPKAIRCHTDLTLAGPRSESDVLDELRTLADHNKCFRSLIGMGYSGTLTPAVILRNILEIQGGIPNIRLIRLKLPKGGWKRCLIFKP